MTIKDLRQLKNMTQQELADAIGVDVSVISRYESGKVTPPTKRLEQISYVLEVNPSEFLSIDFDKPSNAENRLLSYATLIRGKDFYLNHLILMGANGHCELCKSPAPFNDEHGRPYLEIHCLDLKYEGKTPEKNLIALCPNCHRKIDINPSAEDLDKIKEIAKSHTF